MASTRFITRIFAASSSTRSWASSRCTRPHQVSPKIVSTTAAVMPMALPVFENAAFFSSSVAEQRAPFSPIDLYIPSNPFHSLANTVIPAVVLFSIIVAIRLIRRMRHSDPIERRQALWIASAV